MYLTGKVKPKIAQTYHIEKIKKQRAQGQVSHRQGSTTEDKIMVSDREVRKQTAQGLVSEG